MGWGAALGLLGGIAGAQGQRSTQEVNLGPASGLELATGRGLTSDYEALRGLVGSGANAGDVAAGAQGQRDLAAMLRQYAGGGFLPGQQDWQTARNFAQEAFQPQQVALGQQQKQEQLKANQLAAQLGRPVNDPIIQSKLAQERMQQQERLGASQGAYASQFALNLPQQRLGYTAQLADVQSSLASQAMSNRQALLSLGSQLRGQEQNFRLGSASRTVSGGGGLGGAISGAIGGIGAGLGAQGMLGQQAFQTAALSKLQQATPQQIFGGGGGGFSSSAGIGGGGLPSIGSLVQPQIPQFSIGTPASLQPNAQFGTYNPTSWISQPGAFSQAWSPNWNPGR